MYYLIFLFMKELLETDNMEVFHSRNGSEAVDIVSKNNIIDIVLMDKKCL